jgi:hypothetical protein
MTQNATIETILARLPRHIRGNLIIDGRIAHLHVCLLYISRQRQCAEDIITIMEKLTLRLDTTQYGEWLYAICILRDAANYMLLWRLIRYLVKVSSAHLFKVLNCFLTGTAGPTKFVLACFAQLRPRTFDAIADVEVRRLPALIAFYGPPMVVSDPIIEQVIDLFQRNQTNVAPQFDVPAARTRLSSDLWLYVSRVNKSFDLCFGESGPR